MVNASIPPAIAKKRIEERTVLERIILPQEVITEYQVVSNS